MFKKSLSLTVIICFFLTSLGPLPKAHADTVLGLPAPGTMVSLSPAYQPVMIKGLTVHKDNPFLFDFIVDVGQDKMSGQPLKQEGEKLIKYFLATLAIPDRDRWVNLSPYEKDRMIPEALGQTDMGRDLLAQDYILKQITASLIYPEKQLGKTFWDKVYSKAQQTYGTTQIPVNTFNKVWIMADKAEVFEHNQTAFVVNQHLKVMLEEDYLALTKNQMPTRGHVPEGAVSPSTLPSELGLNVQTSQGNPSPALASQIVRAIILPELEKEVNTGKNFANLRQIFNSVILSTWYKKNLKEALLNQVYADQSKVKGINLNDPTVKQQIYEQYLKAYQKGVFNYIKEDINASGETLPRKYFSGGLQARVDLAMTDSTQKLANSLNDNGMVSMTTLASAEGTNPNAVERTGKLYSSIHQLAAASQSVLGQWLTITTKTRKFRMEVLQINEDTSGGKSYTYLEGLLENGDPMKVMGDDFKSAKVDAAMAAGANGIQPQEGVLVFDTMAESSRSEEAAFILPGIKIQGRAHLQIEGSTYKFSFSADGGIINVKLLNSSFDISGMLDLDPTDMFPANNKAANKFRREYAVLGSEWNLALNNKCLELVNELKAKENEIRDSKEVEWSGVKMPVRDWIYGINSLSEGIGQADLTQRTIPLYSEYLPWEHYKKSAILKIARLLHLDTNGYGLKTNGIFGLTEFVNLRLPKSPKIGESELSLWKENTWLESMREDLQQRLVDISRELVNAEPLFKDRLKPLTFDAAMFSKPGFHGRPVVMPKVAHSKYVANLQLGGENVSTTQAVTGTEKLGKKYSLIKDMFYDFGEKPVTRPWVTITIRNPANTFITTTVRMQVTDISPSGEKIEGVGEDGKKFEVDRDRFLDAQSDAAMRVEIGNSERANFPLHTVAVDNSSFQGIVIDIQGDGKDKGSLFIEEKQGNMLYAFLPDGVNNFDVKDVHPLRLHDTVSLLDRLFLTQNESGIQLESQESSVAKWVFKVDSNENIRGHKYFFWDFYGVAQSHLVAYSAWVYNKFSPSSRSLPPGADNQYSVFRKGDIVNFWRTTDGHKFIFYGTNSLHEKGLFVSRVEAERAVASGARIKVYAKGREILFAVLYDAAMNASREELQRLRLTKTPGVSAMSLDQLTTDLQTELQGAFIEKGAVVQFVNGQRYHVGQIVNTLAEMMAWLEKGQRVQTSETDKVMPMGLVRLLESRAPQNDSANYMTWLRGNFDKILRRGELVSSRDSVNPDAAMATGIVPSTPDVAAPTQRLPFGFDQKQISMQKGDTRYPETLHPGEIIIAPPDSVMTFKINLPGVPPVEVIDNGDGTAFVYSADRLIATASKGHQVWRDDLEIGINRGQAYVRNISDQSVPYQIDSAMRTDKAWVQGGIDLNTSNGMQWKVSRDGNGVEMIIDPAMIERVRREGINSLSPVILRITPVASIWPLIGLQAPVK